GGYTVKDVVAADGQRENCVEEKPTGTSDDDGNEEQRTKIQAEADSQKPRAQPERDQCLRYGNEQVERYFAQQIFGAAHRIGEHFVEDAIVAVHEEGPRTIRGNPKA